MRAGLRISELKRRRLFNTNEVLKNVSKYMLTFTYGKNEYTLLTYSIFRNKFITKSSVSFIHNRCVVTLRRVQFFVYLRCLVIKLKILGLMAVFPVWLSEWNNNE